MKKKIIMGMAMIAAVFSIVGATANAITVKAGMDPESADTAIGLDETIKKTTKTTKNNKVVNSFSKSGTYKDDCGNKLKYSYKIPKFNAKTKNAKALNKKIEKALKIYIDGEFRNMERGCSLTYSSVTYKTYSYKNQVSIMATVYDECGCHCYYAWTYDFKKDKAVTNSSLIKQAGFKQKNFLKLAKKKSAALSKKLHKKGKDIDEFIKDNEKNINMKMPMYISSKGKLYVMVPVASNADADYYYKKIAF